VRSAWPELGSRFTLPFESHAIEAVATEMHETYVQAIKEEIHLVDDKIVYDRFHAMRHATNAIKTTRRQERQRLTAAVGHRLSKTNCLWLKRLENLNGEQRQRFDDVFSLQSKMANA
jgi:transposase